MPKAAKSQAVENPMLLPDLPKGWELYEIGRNGADGSYYAEIAIYDRDDGAVVATEFVSADGPTPRAAVLAAVKRVTKVTTHWLPDGVTLRSDD